ncbi:hypothetical protein Scani_47640 [Streptomyces caniferus]|uniref:Uncharacterized protein n=1 Tax=Streptomyces caniferus TaxID=285557 RepID=A0A640SDE6_9ACTN|nr:hypothetical protein Scani_47640 [Streptomyces caniferus]
MGLQVGGPVRLAGLTETAIGGPPPPAFTHFPHGRGRAGGAWCVDVKRSSPHTRPRRSVTAPTAPRSGPRPPQAQRRTTTTTGQAKRSGQAKRTGPARRQAKRRAHRAAGGQRRQTTTAEKTKTWETTSYR